MSLVSVIIPYFKKRKYIKKCIQSVLHQNYKNFEIIIIYDDQNLNDLNYIKKIVSKDKRIYLLINKNSLGAGLSRNKGIKFSKGKFIAFLDADDYWHKEKLKNQIKFMKKKSCLVSHTTYQIIDKFSNERKVRIARDFNNLEDLLYSCDIGLSTVIMNKKVFSRNVKFSNMKTKEDFVLWLSLLDNKISIIGLNKRLSYWRKLDDSLSSSTIQKLLDGFKVYYIYMNFSFIRSAICLFFLSINFLKKDN